MRWIVGIVTALCLLAAAGERPDPRHAARDDASQLTLAGHAASTCTPVRRGGAVHRARLDAFAIVFATASPARTRVTALAQAIAYSPARSARARCASIRGPPFA